MTIAIDLTALSYHMTGIERYALGITEGLLKIDRENKYILIFHDKIYDLLYKYVDHKRVRVKVLKGKNKLFFYQIILPISLYKIRADKYLFFSFTSPILFLKKGIYNTIHDMGPWDVADTLKGLQRFYLRTTCRCSAKLSKGIITVSDFSKKRIMDILNYPEDKIRVVYSAVYQSGLSIANIDYEKVKEEYALPKKYIMSLSTLEPRKNLSILLEAFVDIMDFVEYDLVLVGRKGWKIEDVLKKYGNQSRIHITGYVKDEYVAHIYREAMCFVFPSLYEGFGLPPVEALTFGTPVIASNAASIPEILMDRAIYFSNDSVDELKEILLNLNSIIETAPKALNDYQIYNYSFDNSAKRVLEFIQY